MRNLILLLIVIVLGLIALIATGLVDIRQTRPAELPNVSVDENGIAAQGGRQPAFDVETGSVSVGTETRAVTVPKLQVEPASDGSTDSPSEETTAPAGT